MAPERLQEAEWLRGTRPAHSGCSQPREGGRHPTGPFRDQVECAGQAEERQPSWLPRAVKGGFLEELTQVLGLDS